MPDGARAKFFGWIDRRPRKGLERAAFWLLAWFLLLSAMRWIPGLLGGLAAGLQITVGVVLLMVALPLIWTTIRMRLLWSLRNKLVLTYLLIGLAPVVLIITLVLVSAYVAAGQFAIHLVDARVTSYLMQMGSENEARFRHLQPTVEGHSTRETMNADLPPDDRPAGVPSRFRRDTTCFLDGTSVFHVASARKAPLGLAPWATEVRGGRFHGIVSDGGELYLVALHQQRLNDGRMFTVMNSIPMERELIDLFAEGLGVVRLLPEKTETKQASSDPAPNSSEVRRNRQHYLSETRGGVDPKGSNAADIRVWFPSTLAMTDWAAGQPDNVVLEVDSRPSLLYQQLFGASLSGWVMTVIRVSLTLLVFVFGALWLTAFVMAVRLTRTMTESVADLYDATQRVDRGDLEHKIIVKRTDQLAELSRSFNAMTGSLQRLLVEQKEKERLQNELSIAQEVQANLFPHSASDLPTLELHGVCRPARSVSGDYYDFLVFQEDVPSLNGGRPTRREAGVGIAIGDISGKGISAALLMATLHSAVRAYQFASEELVYSKSALEGLTANKEGLADAGGWFQSPGRIMSLLNRHLFRSTQPEKYATLFLAHYNAASSVLTYSNAGQLPPFVLGKDGSVQRLEEGGTVVGLMDGMHFGEGRVTMQSGDILVAYSDGVTEPENDFGDFGETRLLEVVSRYRTQPLHVISAQVMLALDAWIGAEEQPDDITLVLARQV
ncbi:PP2C family protein-serine/threonine phosphatase [Granulicella sibirica]|uniref:Serine phosphatase n=1 Tax=Granulicella sibirica TaxID=2479048 RepID=A0A4Q0SY42_9BACT|nr:PP2C family protein-serine/threonine phosphatase [Granulicella sibirica]RXH56123.1 Serine phosphatase [Granulicella sibirica]